MSHRGMKPSNVLVFLTGRGLVDVKLTDFGLVRLKSERVESNLLAGTPGWTAPAAFRQYHDDRFVDCYGVGRILFFILTADTWPSEALVREKLCGCVHGCPEACARRESEFLNIEDSGVNTECLDFLRKVLVGSPEMYMDSKEMLEHSYVSYVPLESEQAQIDSAVVRLYSRFNRL
ncbi:hypothetical protein FS837_010206 [Tulasnella sp. UAMH 9824]|nr:hypothetical protein FS837_010206 [Tulasnella sp. UAMH 9824]